MVSIIDQDRCSVVICNTAHEIIYMNPAAVQSYEKWSGADLIGYYEKHEFRNLETMKFYDLFEIKAKEVNEC